MKTISTVAAIVVAVGGIASATFVGQIQAQPDPIDVRLTFQNTTDKPVTFQLIDNTGETLGRIGVDEDTPLMPGQQRTYDSVSGLAWEIVQGGEPIAEYLGDERPLQNIDINELITWQSPVMLMFQNTGDAPVDIFFTDENGIQTLIVDEMPPNQQLAESVPTLPGQLWTIERDGEFYADFIPDNEPRQTIDLKELKTWYEPVQISFQNSSSKPLHIYFVDADERQILYTKQASGRFLPLKPGEKMDQTSNPLHKWVIKGADRKEVVAEYIATNTKQQVVNLTDGLIAPR